MRLRHSFLPLLLGLYLFTFESNAQLTRQWVARFSGGLKNSTNAATAIVVDDSGNAYVTGWVTRRLTGVDMATVKYSPDGEQLWVQYYAAPGSGEDKARAIALDTAGNVYVAGSSSGGASGLDYVTIKYSKDGSGALWVNRYNGPGNGEDVATSIAVNDSLNVYVTGWSLGAGTGFDYLTLKYNLLGIQQWERRYNGPPGTKSDSALALAVNGMHALYVTGTSVDSGYDYATVKYDAASGDTLWVSRYSGAVSGNDIARAVTFSGSSAVFVTGGSQNESGDYDYATIRYNATTGAAVWISRYDGTAGGDDQAQALALRSTSRIYVTGRSLQSGSFNDMTTVEYNQSDGNEVWVASYNGPANDNDGGVAILGGTTPYVLGSSTGSGVGPDYALVQYNSSGSQQFDLRYNGPANGTDIPSDVAAFGKSVYVTGTSQSKDKGSEFLTIRYVDPKHIAYRTFIQESLAVKAANLKTGTPPNAGNVRDQAMLLAYPKIKKGFPGAPGGMIVGNARPDSSSTYGWMRFTKGTGVAKYVPDAGPARGFDLYGGAPFLGEKKDPKREKHNNHLAGALATLRINIGASDAEITPPTLGDITYDDGDTSNHYNGMTLRQIASLVDNYLTYWKQYPSANWSLFDSVLTRANRAFIGRPGRLPWVSTVPLVIPGAVLIDSVAYLQPATAPLTNPLRFPPGSITGMPERYTLYQNYPNPFNPATTIEFDLPEPSVVSLKVYDLLGREVETLLDNESMDEGNQEISFDAGGLSSGVYFYRLLVNHGQYQQVRRMMLIK
jgi:hypothetical protein